MVVLEGVGLGAATALAVTFVEAEDPVAQTVPLAVVDGG